MGAYKRDVVVVIKIGAYIHGAPILCGCLLSGIPGATTSGTINSQVAVTRYKNCFHAIIDSYICNKT